MDHTVVFLLLAYLQATGATRGDQGDHVTNSPGQTDCPTNVIIAEQQSTISSLTNDISSMVSDISTLTRMVRDLTIENSDLQANLSSRSRERSRSSELIRDQQADVAEQHKTILELRMVNQQLEFNISHMETTIEELQANISNYNTQSFNLEDLQLRINLSELAQQANDDSWNRSDTLFDDYDLSINMSSGDCQYAKFWGVIKTQQANLSELVEVNQELSANISDLQDVNNELIVNITSQNAQMESLEDAVAEQQNNISELTEINNELSVNVSRLVSTNGEMRKNATIQDIQMRGLEAIIVRQERNISALIAANRQLAANMGTEEDMDAPLPLLPPVPVTESSTPQGLIGDCKDIYDTGARLDGPYRIELSTFNATLLCKEMADGEPWTVIQQRVAGDASFQRRYDVYKEGFGTVSTTTDFWMGLEGMHRLTSKTNFMLHVDLADWDGQTSYAEYSQFAVGAEDEGFKLTVDGYTGTAGDSLAWHNGMWFSTYDHDRDLSTTHCAERARAGWWFWACHYSNLNGEFFRSGANNAWYGFRGIQWYHWKQRYTPLKSASMKIRRVPTE